jgi:hypothetical protein
MQRAFQKLKPYHVQPLKDRNVCCCKYHVELDMLKFGLNFLKGSKKGIHAKLRYKCECIICNPFVGESNDNVMCSALGKVYKGIIQLWQDCV